MNAAIAFVQEQYNIKKEVPKFKAGDNVTVNYKILEGNKERIQGFKGDVIKRQGVGLTATFTVRKISAFLNRPVDTVEKQLRKATWFLRDNLKQYKEYNFMQ